MLNQYAVDNPTLPVNQCFSPPHPDPGGMLSRSLGIAEPQTWAAKHLGHTWYIGKRFCKSNGFFVSTLFARVETMDL